MKHKIVMDSAGDIQSFAGLPFACVPLKILAGDKEFVDDRDLNVRGMVEFLRGYKGKASTACPGVGEYLEAFEDAENVYVITITSGLSGSYNSAKAAVDAYLEQYPQRKAHVFDSLSTGPHMLVIAEKIQEKVEEGLPFEEVVRQVSEYQKNTRLLFSLESLHNLANNGRVPVAVAKVAGILGIRMLGRASDKGTLEPMSKVRGAKKVTPELMRMMSDMSYAGGKVRINHCLNEEGAEHVRQAVLERFPNADVAIGTTGALCSFYAEQGGLLVAFEMNAQ